MEKIVHRAHDRGHADHGWLNAHHSFSFANYYHPEKNNFGLLRVLNDDVIAPGRGFGNHPHDNMEIVTIPLRGSLKHTDSMGNSEVIKVGEVQSMSAGKGIFHSEFNASANEEINLLQIWVFPKLQNIEPRYEQLIFEKEDRKNKFQTLVSPNNKVDGGMWINQDAWFSLSDLEEGNELTYKVKLDTNGVYLFLIEGEIEVADELLVKRDAIGVYDADNLVVKANKNSTILVIEVPMN